MATLVTVTQGWTKELGPFTLRVDGEPIDLTNHVVTLQLRARRAGSWVDTAGDVRVDPDQVVNRGKVYYKPDAADLLAGKSPYECRFRVTDPAGDDVFFPHAEPDEFIVHL